MFKQIIKILTLMVTVACSNVQAYTKADLENVQQIVQNMLCITQPAELMATLSDDPWAQYSFKGLGLINRNLTEVLDLALENNFEVNKKNFMPLLIRTICDALSVTHSEAKRCRELGRYESHQEIKFLILCVIGICMISARNWFYRLSKETYPSFEEEFQRRSMRAICLSSLSLFLACMGVAAKTPADDIVRLSLAPFMLTFRECLAHIIISNAEDYGAESKKQHA